MNIIIPAKLYGRFLVYGYSSSLLKQVPMDEKEITRFSWSGLFLVTSVCSFMFTGAIWLLDKQISITFLAIALATLLLSVLNWAFKSLKNVSESHVDMAESRRELL